MSARLVLLATLLAAPPSGRAEDRVTVRGVYYRETSTRVVQPMVKLEKDLPAGVDVGAHFLVDAITSASVAAGALQDTLFTEYRKEAGFTVGKTFDRTRIGAFYRHSREPDFLATDVGLSLAQGVWDNTGTVLANVAYGSDTVGPMLDQHLAVTFGSLSYLQALSPTLAAQVGYEALLYDGYQANPYLRVPNFGYESLPKKRMRHAAVARLAHYLPTLGAGVQLHYRLYYDHGVGEEESDPWNLLAHTVELRLHKELTSTLEARFSYRFYTQGAAAFWCNTSVLTGGSTECYGLTPHYYSVDPKLGPMRTHTAEVKVTWEARALRTVPLLGWFAGGAFDLSYGRYFQNTRYGNAHVLQTAYSLPF